MGLTIFFKDNSKKKIPKAEFYSKEGGFIVIKNKYKNIMCSFPAENVVEIKHKRKMNYSPEQLEELSKRMKLFNPHIKKDEDVKNNQSTGLV